MKIRSSSQPAVHCTDRRRFTLPKTLALGLGLGTLCAAPALPAQSVSVSTNMPSVGAGVSYTKADGTVNSGTNFNSNYVAGDNGNSVGQVFTTPSAAGATGYLLNFVSMLQVSAATTANGTAYEYSGGHVGVQIFQLGSYNNNGSFTYNITPLLTETAAVGGTPSATGPSFDPTTPAWLTVTLSKPFTLAPGVQYGFQITSDGYNDNNTGGDTGLFMEIDGSTQNPRTGSFAVNTAKPGGGVSNGGLGIDFNTSTVTIDSRSTTNADFAFVANMTAVPEPSTFVLAGLGGLSLAVWRRRSKG